MRHSEEWHQRLNEAPVYAKPLQLKATAAGFIKLDKDYHLENVVYMLRNMQLAIAAAGMGVELNEANKQTIVDYLRLLHDLANEFDWQARHGVRLYSPL